MWDTAGGWAIDGEGVNRLQASAVCGSVRLWLWLWLFVLPGTWALSVNVFVPVAVWASTWVCARVSPVGPWRGATPWRALAWNMVLRAALGTDAAYVPLPLLMCRRLHSVKNERVTSATFTESAESICSVRVIRCRRHRRVTMP